AVQVRDHVQQQQERRQPRRHPADGALRQFFRLGVSLTHGTSGSRRVILTLRSAGSAAAPPRARCLRVWLSSPMGTDAPAIPCRKEVMMKLESIKDLYVSELKDLYDAEQQIIQALPKMAQAASSPELKSAFQEHLGQTKGQ